MFQVLECFVFCSFHSFKILLLLVIVSPFRAFLSSYVNWLCAFFMTNFISNTLPRISHTTLCLAIKKFIYTTPIYSLPENLRSLCQALPKVVYDLGLVETDVHHESINSCTKYSLLLNKFAECHQMLNGKIEFDDEKVEGFSKM